MELDHRIMELCIELVDPEYALRKKRLELGQLLVAKKQSLWHGEFRAWLSENCSLSISTVWNYMKMAEAK